MSDNVVKFKKKYTLEEEQINLLANLLTDLHGSKELLVDYVMKPWLATEHWRNVFIQSLLAANTAAIEWLILDLKDTKKSSDPELYNMYVSLIEWYKSASKGQHFAFTFYSEDHATVQYIFLFLEDGRLALAALYDDQKDMVSGVIEVLNGLGMRALGFQDDVLPE